MNDEIKIKDLPVMTDENGWDYYEIDGERYYS